GRARARRRPRGRVHARAAARGSGVRRRHERSRDAGRRFGAARARGVHRGMDPGTAGESRGAGGGDARRVNGLVGNGSGSENVDGSGTGEVGGDRGVPSARARSRKRTRHVLVLVNVNVHVHAYVLAVLSNAGSSRMLSRRTNSRPRRSSSSTSSKEQVSGYGMWTPTPPISSTGSTSERRELPAMRKRCGSTA